MRGWRGCERDRWRVCWTILRRKRLRTLAWPMNRGVAEESRKLMGKQAVLMERREMGSYTLQQAFTIAVTGRGVLAIVGSADWGQRTEHQIAGLDGRGYFERHAA